MEHNKNIVKELELGELDHSRAQSFVAIQSRSTMSSIRQVRGELASPMVQSKPADLGNSRRMQQQGWRK